MAKKKNKSKKYNMDEEVIIGYNTKKRRTGSPKKKREKKKRQKKWNKIKKVLLAILKIILIIAILVGIALFLFVSPVFNITDVKVENARKITVNTYISLSEIQIGENIFKINKSKIRETIKEQPYVENVEIKRELPGTVKIIVKEREPKYLIESNGMYIYIDKNGYALETNVEKIELPILKGISTDVSKLKMGEVLVKEDIDKFNDLIKIIDGIKNNNIEAVLSCVNISDDDNYILEFAEEGKTTILGDTSNLSTKMLWIKYLLEKEKGIVGTIHINNIDNVYFSPVE